MPEPGPAGLAAVLASSNPNKLRELRAALPDWEIEPIDADFPPEDGDTYYENARAKALAGRGVAPDDLLVLGEDSGIEAAALGGRPGVASARWADDGVAALLKALDAEEDRRVRYVSDLVAIAADGSEHRGRGTLEGTAAREPRGSEGFGYDPILIPLGETRTVAELGDAWKLANSHRARAAQALRSALVRADT